MTAQTTPTSEGRIRRSWRLTRLAWDLVRSDRTMLVLAFMGTGFATLATGLILYASGFFSNPDQGGGHFTLFGLAGLYLATLTSVFFNVALAKAADSALSGRSLGVRGALSATLRQVDQVALWALLAAGVGAMLNEVASRVPGLGKLATLLAGASWWLATIFVVPILAVEGGQAVPALRRSIGLAKQRWGEGASGSLTVTTWMLLVAIPAGIVIGVGLGVLDANAPTGVALITVGVLVLVAAAVLSAAVVQVFSVALFRFATHSSAVGFPVEDLQHPFSPRRSLRALLRL